MIYIYSNTAPSDPKEYNDSKFRTNQTFTFLPNLQEIRLNISCRIYKDPL